MTPKDKIRDKVLAVMTSGQSYPLASAATLLWLGSLAYKTGVGHRARQYATGRKPVHRLPCSVISVGNITLGGTGKTPMTVYLARFLTTLGKRVAILSRGYKGAHGRDILVVSDGDRVLADARMAGDEPCLMAHLLPGLPVVVGRDRVAAGMLAIDRFASDVLLLDDGFQHLRLARDVNLLLLDARNPFGNGYLFPRGTLRESPEAMARSDAFIMTRDCPAARATGMHPFLSNQEKPTFRTVHQPVVRGQIDRDAGCPPLAELTSVPLDSSWLRALPLFAFSALAGNQGFRASIHRAGGAIKGTMGFADHHRYCRADLERIRAAAWKSGAQCLITTDKDYVRLPLRWRWDLPLLIMGVEIDFPAGQAGWHCFIADQLAR